MPDIHSSALKSRQRFRLSVFITYVGFATLAIYPFNNAAPGPMYAVLSCIVLTSAIASSVLVVTTGRSKLLFYTVLFLGVPVVAVLLTSPDRAIQVVLLASAWVVGLGFAALRSKASSGFLVVLILTNCLVLVLEAVTVTPFLQAIGLQVRIDYLTGPQGERVLGLMGHPLLSSFVVVLLGVLLVSKSWTTNRTGTTVIFLVSSLTAATLTGTRSALLVTIAVSVILWVSAVWKRELHPLARTATAFAGAALVVISYLYASSANANTLRVLDFESLASSSSFLVRASSFDLLLQAENANRCLDTCVILGHGYRASTDYFANNAPSLLVQTLDNTFLTLWFDFHLIALLILIALLTIGIKILRRDRTMGLVFLSVIAMSGLFFDYLYVMNLLALIAATAACGLQRKSPTVEETTRVKARSVTGNDLTQQSRSTHKSREFR